MSDAWRYGASGLTPGETGVDRDVKIEQLLLAGLDHYFSAQYDQAINVWTRVLFLDRGHARARAYIERARGALAERQRESEELLQAGVTAFDRGDVAAARELLSSAVERGGPHDDAVAILDRVSRLEAAAGHAEPAGRDRSVGRPRPARVASNIGRRPGRSVRMLPVVLLVGVVAGGLYAAAAWDRLEPLPLLNRVDPASAVSAGPEEPIPVPSASEMALARARLLFAQGSLHESLRVLAAIKPGDPLNTEADSLRATIQQTLLAIARESAIMVPGADAPAQR